MTQKIADLIKEQLNKRLKFLELGEAFKEDLLKNARRIKRDKTEYQKKCSEEIIEASKKLEELEKIDPTDILTLTRLHGGRL